MLKANEIRDQSSEELEALAYELSREIFELRSQRKLQTGSSKPHELRFKRRDLARVKTVLEEKCQTQLA